MTFPLEIPTFENDSWSTTTFETREKFRDFIISIFSEPGKYGFDETAFKFNEQGRLFKEKGVYCLAPFKSRDFLNYWDAEKKKCMVGVIFKNKNKTWYLTRDYYMWLNFLPIYDKEEKLYGFAKVRDAQYHITLYELLAELSYRHASILKKRQIASSYLHCAKIINKYWFDSGAVIKIGASLKDYINEKGIWKFIDEYRNFLNQHTAWYRHNEPDKVLSWQQKIKVRTGGRDTYIGLKSTISGSSFEKDPTAGVGGPTDIFYHEEAGIAPMIVDTYEYMRPAFQSGMVTTGIFIAAGSVGDLSQCEGLRKFTEDPESHDIFPVTSDLIDKKGTLGKTGLFIPEQWSMPPYIDQYGNSKVEEALEAIKKEREEWRTKLSPDQFQLRVSQKPTNIEEAFAIRKESIFPPHLLTHQHKRIEDKEVTFRRIDLSRDATGKILVSPTNKLPINVFPIDPKLEDKTGAICVYEEPIPNAPWGTYFASVDPVGAGKSDTSYSLCSIQIYKNATEVVKVDANGNRTVTYERDGIVAWWCGRFDDLQKTHERLELLIEYYNAWTIVENNVSLFIQYMIEKRKQKYLVPKSQIIFLKDLQSNNNVYQEYGWRNTGTLFKDHLIRYGIQYVSEEIDKTTKENGDIERVFYGVERIPDPMLLVEMMKYQPGLNVDRLISFCSLVAFAKVQQSNRESIRRVEIKEDKLENPQKNIKLLRGPFVNIGNSNHKGLNLGGSRSPFKHIR